MTQPTRLIPALTGLRYGAALGVLFCHFSSLLPPHPLLSAVAELGGHGVGLFFVLSGFVITHNIVVHPDQSWSGFVLQRLSRILPLTWLMLALVSLAYALYPGDLALMGPYRLDPQWVVGSWVVNFLCLQAWVPDFQTQQYWNAPAWSLSAELFFYALAPFWVTKLLTLKPRTLLMFTALSTGVAYSFYRLMAPAWIDDPYILDFFPLRLPLFGLLAFTYGIGFYRLYQTQPTKNCTFSIVGLMLLLMGSYALKGEFKVTPAFDIGFYYLTTLPLFGALIHQMARDQGVISRVLSSPPLNALGNASFALYLMHWLPLEGVIASKVAFNANDLVLTIGVLSLGSLALHNGFEKPVRHWILRRFAPAFIQEKGNLGDAQNAVNVKD
jgi:peptidoglycan/LPS O-acetylase OafA/YrhL